MAMAFAPVNAIDSLLVGGDAGDDRVSVRAEPPRTGLRTDHDRPPACDERPGRASVLDWWSPASPAAIALIILADYLSDALEGRERRPAAARLLLLAGAAVMGRRRPLCAAVAARGSVFDNVHAETVACAAHAAGRTSCGWSGHWPVRAGDCGIRLVVELRARLGDAAAVLSCRTPCTPTDAAVGAWWNAIFGMSPSFLTYAAVRRPVAARVALRNAAALGHRWSAVAQGVVPLALHVRLGDGGADRGRRRIGLMGGVATAAYMDLLIRSCPTGVGGHGA